MRIDKNSRQFKRGVKEERKEHPWAGKKGAERIVADHLGEHPYMYKKK
ncbi:MAG: hypothetical protein PHV83_05585 [Bacteroidales bacterium]|nr:hypothetical protein [Bacteroidales bacterium]